LDGFSHKIHLILPALHNATSRPAEVLPLKIRAPTSLTLTSTAEGYDFSDLVIHTGGDVDLEDIVAQSAWVYTESGGIHGSYNVSRSLVLKTETGNIVANITAFPNGGPGGPHGPHGPPGPHGPHGPHDPEHHHGHHKDKKSTENETEDLKDAEAAHPHPDPHPHPHPPMHHVPTFIGAFSENGSITLDIYSVEHPASLLSVVTRARTELGDVSVHISDFFKGFFAAAVEKGSIDIATEGNKTIEILHETVSDHGSKIMGFVHPPHPEGKSPHPHKPHKGKKGEKGDQAR
jgi:hypothetical protein